MADYPPLAPDDVWGAALKTYIDEVAAGGATPGYSNADAVAANLAALQAGDHYGMLVGAGTAANSINLRPTVPTVLVPTGSTTAPPGTPANCLIVARG